jgi:hypothetical protein
VGTTSSNHCTSNGGTAAKAGLAGSLVDGEPLLHLAIAIRRRVVVDRRASRCNCFCKHSDECGMEEECLRCVHARRINEWMEARTPEGFVGVDIPDPRNVALVEKKDLQSRAVGSEECMQDLWGKRRLEGFVSIVGKERGVIRIK